MNSEDRLKSPSQKGNNINSLVAPIRDGTVELYRCKKTHDLERAEVENALCRVVARCSCVREAEGHVQTDSD
jgi:hypothetical protein